jgi:predicted ABC-type ATPase
MMAMALLAGAIVPIAASAEVEVDALVRWPDRFVESHIDRSYHGYYGARRTHLQEEIVRRTLAEAGDLAEASDVPSLVILGGPMAAGKSTMVPKIVAANRSVVHIDLDKIRTELPEFIHYVGDDQTAAIISTNKEAGYIAELILWTAIKHKKNILFESSMASASTPEFLITMVDAVRRVAPEYNGHIQLVFIFADLKTLISNVDKRNTTDHRQTQHYWVNERYYRSLNTFFYVKHIFDYVMVIDNSEHMKKIVSVESPRVTPEIGEVGQSVPYESIKKFWPELVTKSLLQHRPANLGYDIFLDLDWSLFDFLPVEEALSCATCTPYPPFPSEQLEDLKHSASRAAKAVQFIRPIDWLVPFLTGLQKIPGVRIHVITGADRDRANYMLSQVKISDHTTALELVQNVFTLERLLPIAPAGLPGKFEERVTKYVQGLVPHLDMSRTLLFDDTPGFARLGLSVLHSYGMYHYLPEFPGVQIPPKPYYPLTHEEHRRSRDRLKLAFNLIREAIELDRSGVKPFRQFFSELNKKGSGKKPMSILNFDAKYFAEPTGMSGGDLMGVNMSQSSRIDKGLDPSGWWGSDLATDSLGATHGPQHALHAPHGTCENLFLRAM